ncbi:MAG: ribonuclease P protein subunit, partial [Firmicutes bacterium]|nr:ribonuclease P protein subunit [Bacillota bacterium]
MISSKNIFYHELIGLELKVVDSSNPSLIGLRGTVIDETKKTLLIEVVEESGNEDFSREPVDESSNENLSSSKINNG